ncbi:PorT family protein [Echinicola marina]|uniref:porin family protein n=1 Tax=Echinicola marina TaxID=2859768 RepID=UPI001CF67BB5|nr:porin family protein [Echinicola marina]UCS92385.1 PorT family protein [Echinicola marina]
MKTVFLRVFFSKVLLSLASVQYAKSQAMLLVLLFGDNAATENFFFSIEGGVNFAYLPGMDGRLSLQPNFGVGVNMKMNDHWYFVPQFKPVSRKGQKLVNVNNPFPEALNAAIKTSETSLRMNYLDIPLMFRYGYNDKVFLSAGPQISFLLDAKAITEGETNNDGEFKYAKNVKNELNKIDFSFPIEVGYTLVGLNKGNGLDLKLRYAHGFAEVFSEGTGRSATNSVVQLIVGFPYLKSPKPAVE